MAISQSSGSKWRRRILDPFLVSVVVAPFNCRVWVGSWKPAWADWRLQHTNRSEARLDGRFCVCHDHDDHVLLLGRYRLDLEVLHRRCGGCIWIESRRVLGDLQFIDLAADRVPCCRDWDRRRDRRPGTSAGH